ncbi:2-oxoglutarate dehydrogenase complex dihydrolipoyllysine-residue succinyltransferase [Sedimenticola selenatireducens]|uniref:Dihydrolipoyllysine-residue succinyltransferase component of 2-oxoglutarate dehydrogenase complex n=1 Tax=Sedimenticola selenatireducens TaxID=191960 RepID=A0A557SCY8_9GAMM|nr:2-oxoglutarate dehydrogenase complex dihydrolipoyllysine-residue succinyltransferase [Sedimenticola selenatireducens]TVO75264.1 2-oxoglutarate dehydrogenase complex dihydrolipoyllysine-residue succinyltransferase [Sedimenticola selenatireducens]TVT66883.1 MAG: 2-oxoglutarate dehydrogenase complex dihydrolipoyllysine-residue succinyltransferase [Sedimenticola selenatireducens]
MSTNVTVPALPESVADATILAWHKKPGDPVSRDENLVDLETDKVVLEVPSPIDGIMGAISAAEGETVTAGDLLTVIQEGAAVQAQAPAAEATEAAADGEIILTPAVRRLVKEKGIDPKEIVGTGKDGRILKTDVTAYIESLEASSKSAVSMTQESEITQSGVEGDRPEQRVPMTRLRARIAERLLEAQQNAAILTTFNEVDLQAINDLRKNYKDKFEKDHEVKLGFMSFFIKASVEALKQFPAVNASVDGKDIIYHGYYDIGIAVGSPRGLVVPILRDADQLGFADTEKAVRDFGKKANDGSLSYEELTGGTFTISNGGVFGSMLSTPILNPPQSAILGMHTIQQRPMVVNGEIVIRPMMYLALSYDHRIVDGREAVQFLVTIKNMLEDPTRLLLQV